MDMIAYTSVMPYEPDLSALMESVQSTSSAVNMTSSGVRRTISAYDGDRLIGFGKAVSAEVGVSANVWVLDEYRNRDVERVIGKLLSL